MGSRRRRLASTRKAAGYTQESLAEALNVDRTTVIRWETGENEPQPFYWPKLSKLLRISSEELRQLLAEPIEAAASASGVPPAPDAVELLRTDCVVLRDAETLRCDLADAVDHAAMSDASLDDWEHTVYRYGLANRYRPAASLLVDLTVDFAELRRVLERRRAILVPNRLIRIVAQMAGLMSLTLIRLDQQTAARSWARTAKLVASEAGDSKLHAWVLAQEAYAHYYSGNPVEALYVAAHAQHVANQAPCSGVALAAALEARAHSLLGKTTETTTAIGHATHALAGMDDEQLLPSAFGYNEARLCFHSGNAYTHLSQTKAAFEVHERALALYPSNDYFDRALVMLDRAQCLVHGDDLPTAVNWAAQALRTADGPRRDAMIENRAREVLGQMRAKAPTLPEVRELAETLRAGSRGV